MGDDGGKNRPIVLDDDDDDDEIELIQSTSRQTATKRSECDQNVASRPTIESSSVVAAPSAPSLSALIGDRAQLEKERLERQRKRRKESGHASEDEGGDVDGTAESRPSATKKMKMKEIFGTFSQSKATTSPSASIDTPPDAIKRYWNGGFEKSFNRYCSQDPGQPFSSFLLPTTPFRAAGLTHVIMASFCEDLQWLAPLFPKGARGVAPEITMVTHAPMGTGSSHVGVHAPMHPDLPNWVRLVIPRIKNGPQDYETQHMKFMLLFYPDRLRILILSGNFVDYDWERIENTAFIHDFPRHDCPGTKEEGIGTDLRKILDSLNIPAGHHAQRMLHIYDFSQTKTEARLVISRPLAAAIQGWDNIEEWGLGRLGKVVREILDAANKRKESRKGGGIALEAQGSSMGTYSTRWLQQVHILASGVDPRKGALPLPAGKKADAAWAKAIDGKPSDKWPPIRLLFPSERWVKTSAVEGPPGAGTFFGKKTQSVSRGFVDLCHQPLSKRGDIMMHHKSLLALLPGVERGSANSGGDYDEEEEEEDEEETVGWIYMGSHNLTQAAWGNISSTSSTAPPQFTCQNWELGLVLPLRRKDLRADTRTDTGKIVTWKRPVEKYRQDDVPWDQYQQ